MRSYYDEDLDEYEEEEGEEQERGLEEEEEGYEEEEAEEDQQPCQEALQYLEFRQRLKEKIRKERGSSACSSGEKKGKHPNDRYGSFFGPSQPVIAPRVIQESKSLLENRHLAAKVLDPRTANKRSSESKPQVGPKHGGNGQPPKAPNEFKMKVQKLRDTRDYSFLLSEDAEPPAPSKEPSARNVSAPKSDARSAQVVPKSKQQLVSSGRHVSSGYEERRSASVSNGHVHSKGVPNKLISGKPHSTVVDSRKQIGSYNGSGPGRPVAPKGLPSKSSVATMEKKSSAVAAKNSMPGMMRPPTSKMQTSVSKQQLEHRKEPREPSKTQVMQKQQLLSSKPQVNKPLKQIPSHALEQKKTNSHAIEQRRMSSHAPVQKKVLSRVTSPDQRPRKKPLRPYMDDDDDDGATAISMIRKMFGYNPNKYQDDDDDINMEANFDDILREERRSAKIARKEDEEQLRLIEEEERMERIRKMKKRKLSHQ